ncbi:DUF2867 domain-containing protein [Nonomuraea sp. NPDC049400]|uniref:DUF2867 domain-containing protein n=1 Tax=Nonomuraea sp. NPDC049400 TaxID=3364352 RepID=UPI0037B34E91
MDTDVAALRTLSDTGDFTDTLRVRASVGLRTFVAGALGWAPGWLRFLYWTRGLFARMLRTAHPVVRPGSGGMRPEDVPFTPGGRIGFFSVVEGVEDHHLLLEASDSHLAAYLAIVADGEDRYRMVTVIRYLHWTGRLYFLVIRPFHWLVVRGMARAGALGRWNT